jgi:hypothetical protein
MSTKFKGIPVLLGDRTFVVPPLNFKSLRELQDRLANYTGQLDSATIQLVFDATQHALLRNYTAEDIADLENLLDVGNMQEVMEAVMDASGLKRKEFEAAQAAASTDPSTGTTSTVS